jgi:hypothetical protein
LLSELASVRVDSHVDDSLFKSAQISFTARCFAACSSVLTSATSITSDKENSVVGSIGDETHSTLPNTSFATTLLRDIELLWLRCTGTGLRSLNICDTDAASFADCNKHSSVIPVVTVATKAGTVE